MEVPCWDHQTPVYKGLQDSIAFCTIMKRTARISSSSCTVSLRLTLRMSAQLWLLTSSTTSLISLTRPSTPPTVSVLSTLWYLLEETAWKLIFRCCHIGAEGLQTLQEHLERTYSEHSSQGAEDYQLRITFLE